jgi:hypothetical protein
MTEDHGAAVGDVLKVPASAAQFTNMTLGDASNILRNQVPQPITTIATYAVFRCCSKKTS